VKPDVPVAAVTEFLGEILGWRPSFIERLNEGQESQAFRFDDGKRALVLRMGPSIRGRIGIEEVRESLRGDDHDMAEWALARCLELIEARSSLP